MKNPSVAETCARPIVGREDKWSRTMTDGNPRGSGQESEDRTGVEPEAKGRSSGRTANEGTLAGPSSDDAGAPIAPQTGDPHGDDRQG